jgi:hypothetical protein
VGKEALAQDPAYARIGGLELRDVLDHGKNVGDGMISGLDQVKVTITAPRVGQNATHSRCAFDVEMKLCGKGRVNRSELGTGIHHEVVWTRVVDFHADHDENALNGTQA